MVSKSLREWLRVLEQDGVLKHVGREVNLEHELAAVGKKACGTYAVWFDKPIGERLPKDNKIPVVTGICGNRAMFAKAMGVSAREMSGTFSEAQAHPIEPVVVPPGEAPVKAVVTRQVNLYGLPIPVHHEKDSGQYITAGVVVAKDPVTGQRNVSIHRLQVTDKNHLGVLLLPRHLMALQRMAEKSGNPLEVAICIGLDPIALLSSQAIAALGFDEFGIAGALYGEPMKLVKGETVNVEYPANAEIVLEGRILPNIRQPEGPFGEYPKYYGPRKEREVIELTCMCTKRSHLPDDCTGYGRTYHVGSRCPRGGNFANCPACGTYSQSGAPDSRRYRKISFGDPNRQEKRGRGQKCYFCGNGEQSGNQACSGRGYRC